MTKITQTLESDPQVSCAVTGLWSAASAIALVIGLLVVAPDVRAQWTVINLHPPGEWAGSWAAGTTVSQQVGSVLPDGGGIGIGGRHASLWDGTAASWVNLHPDEFWTESEALGVADHQQVGYVYYSNLTSPYFMQRACLWSGSAASILLLADVRSSALATSGTNQVGWVAMTLRGPSRASLWSGTPESLVDLHPAGALNSSAIGISGTQQVGFADGHAGLWHGTAESWVDLHPAGATTSVAVWTTGTLQVGNVFVDGATHASMWSGTAASWVDLHPIGATESSASAILGDWQVGQATFSDGRHASFWNGTAGSWEDLSLSLTGSWVETFATGIWRDGSTLSISGYGYNLNTERTEALLWTRQIPEPSALVMLGLGSALAARRRCRGGRMPSRSRLVLGRIQHATPNELCSSSMNMTSTRVASMLAIAAGIVVAAPEARAQWTVTNLHPASRLHTYAFGVSGTQQVGATLLDGGPGPGGPGHRLEVPHAGLWSGSAGSWTDLNPAGWDASVVNATSGTQQVGNTHVASMTPGGAQHAGLWNGTAASWVDLHPAGAERSEAFGTSGGQQVGYARMADGSHAGLWNGTAASWGDLHPAGARDSEARDTSGTHQVGSATFLDPDLGFYVGHAGIWHGTAESWVDLHPAGSVQSFAAGISGTQQVGDVYFGDVTGSHASLWSGTAASWVDLNPAGAMTSNAAEIFGAWQVGSASFDGVAHAGLWSGTASSWEDLSLALTGSWGDTHATGIWSDGSTLSVTGYGYNLNTERTEALLWTRPVPEPSVVALFGLGGRVAARRRRARVAVHLEFALTGGQAAARTSTTSQHGGFS